VWIAFESEGASALNRATDRLKNDGSFMHELVMIDPEAALHASERLMGNSGFVLGILERYSGRVGYERLKMVNVSTELKTDRQFLLSAVESDDWVLECTGEITDNDLLRLRDDPNFMEEAVRKNPFCRAYISPRLRMDPLYMHRIDRAVQQSMTPHATGRTA
jgi:hypothetical protein